MRATRSLTAYRIICWGDVFPGWHACQGWGMHAQGGVCAWGVHTQGVCMPGGVHVTHAPCTEILTHACENITFPQLLLR